MTFKERYDTIPEFRERHKTNARQYARDKYGPRTSNCKWMREQQQLRMKALIKLVEAWPKN